MTDSNCPPWCAGTHQAGTGYHEGPVQPVSSVTGTQMWSRPVMWDSRPHVSAFAYAGDTAGTLIVCDQEQAGDLATVLDALASAAPADIRAFAAQVRQASAQAFADPEAEA